ncbi:hypothetical protein EVAR_53135_1 [Eumeta japonica]|uniref:Uncharacterized protein n=1 Tax=Eumeta variegata TaxID=151549 RepID=A0A4C1YE71_EUMVA|nr:hypothetical protein EVAR_53135_1 [Eumeta japonica]
MFNVHDVSLGRVCSEQRNLRKTTLCVVRSRSTWTADVRGGHVGGRGRPVAKMVVLYLPPAARGRARAAD